MEQQSYGFNKELGTKGTAMKRAAIFLYSYLFHIWPSRVEAHHIFVWLSPRSQWLHFCSQDNTGL